MADTDYTVRGLSGSFATVANLANGVAPLDTRFDIVSLKTSSGDSRVIGEGIMIGKEIVRLVEVGDTYFTVARGCADTIPAAHPAGEILFFYEDAIAADTVPALAGQTLGVKVLPQTVRSPLLPIAAAPPNTLLMQFRFARPYPPGQVKVAGNPWFGYPVNLTAGSPSPVVVSWASRNRVTQADILVDHVAASVNPEDGQTTVLRFFDSAGTLRHTEETTLTSISLTAATVTAWMIDGGVSGAGNMTGYILLNSKRDGLLSLQGYRLELSYSITQPYGLGYRLGTSLGGKTP